MSYPVTAVIKPSGLAGTTNGKLPDSTLAPLGAPGRASARAHRQTVRSFKALAAEVLAQFGETLTVTSSADAYRTYDVQDYTFRSRYTTSYLAGRPYKTWNGVRWYQKPGTAMAAVPGTSNHGWALALDVCLWRDNAIVGITANKAMFTWLLAPVTVGGSKFVSNAARFGFSWEAQSEPWHLRLFSGDATPSAVLAFEKPTPAPAPTPVTPTAPTTNSYDWNKDDDMKFISKWHDGSYWEITADLQHRNPTPIRADIAWRMIASGVPEIELDPAFLPTIPA